MDAPAPNSRSILCASITVFVIAVTVRVPSCYESFWLDELHSAWTVWHRLADVFPRADIGHQSPFYFTGLWLWKQMVGESEVGLRLSSVLAVAISSVVLTLGVTQWARSLAAGTAAGLVMALESNALFFGTELRPYAFVILFSSIASVCFLRLLDANSRHCDRRAWVGMVVATLLAALCQPTALGILVWLPFVLFLIWLARDRRQFLRFHLSDGLLLLSIAAVGFALWRITVGESWQQRGQWSSFATATRPAQIWQVWDWTWLLLLPVSTSVVSTIVMWLRGRAGEIRSVTIATLYLALIAVLGTSLYWIVARFDVVPIWHRRYFIAVLPLFACLMGGAVGAVTIAFPRGITGWFTALALAFALAFQQGTLLRLREYPVALVVRGEDWRAANAWVNGNAEPQDLVFMDAGLVEGARWHPQYLSSIRYGPTLTPEQSKYLVFAAAGPYQVKTHVIPIIVDSLEPPWSAVRRMTDRTRRVFIIVRRPAYQVRKNASEGSLVRGFGNISVIQQSTPAIDLQR